MDRLLRLSELWPYLPAFRAVAETEHLPTAADRLHLTPSALSRAIRQLEQRLGQSLFARRGRRIVLNDSGQAFLNSVRDAMRRLDDGVAGLVEPEPAGPLRVVSVSQLATTLLVEALPEFLARFPRLEPELASSASAPLSDLLLRGELDAAFSEVAVRRPGLTLTKLGSFRNLVYCARGHPLAGRKAVKTEQLQRHAFVAPPQVPGPPLDDWPPELERKVALRVDQMQAAMACCAQGRLLGVFPERVVQGHALGERLVPVAWNRLPVASVYALTRARLGTGDAAAALVDAVANTCALA
ncbi:MAG: LysR family transcriptional regulator [Planctomycetes bacterium]|nr:LysR family transcriptional regulator [Planctomycetota bacterium]